MRMPTEQEWSHWHFIVRHSRRCVDRRSLRKHASGEANSCVLDIAKLLPPMKHEKEIENTILSCVIESYGIRGADESRCFLSRRAGLFVEVGFQAKGDRSGWPWAWKKSYIPPPGWNKKFQDEWVFEYTLPKSTSTFFLHCSTRNGKMYVRAIRANNMEEQPDIGVLGLETSNYVPPKEEIVAARSWGSVLRNVEKLTSQAHEHLILPFLTKESRPLPPANEAYNWKEYIAVKASEWTDAKLLVPALSAGLVFAMGIGMSVYRRRISL